MEASASSSDQLLPFTRLVLVVSAVVQFIFGGVCVFFLDLWNSLLWPSPLPAMDEVVSNFAGINYLGTTIAAVYALYLGSWIGARVYFAYSFPYNAMAIIVTLVTVSGPGVPPIMWLYVLLAVLYLLVVAFVWVRQSRGAASPRVR